MIDAKDLRIGNFILDLKNGSIASVIKLNEALIGGKKEIRVNGNSNQEYKPISLSEEWLHRLGFTTQGIIKKEIVKDGKKITLYLNDLSGYGFATEIGIIKLEYVHHLQNLFYILTGQELEFK